MNPSFGSGSSLLGAPASSVLGMPGGLQQQTPSSASFQPGMLPNTPRMPSPMPQIQQMPNQSATQLPQSSQMPSIGAPGPVNQGVVGLPPSNPESLMIIKALTSRLSSINKADELKQGAVA